MHLRIIADLVVLAFFFLLRVGEYTPSTTARRTVPLRRQDIKLWGGMNLLSHQASLDELLSADSVTISLENQKNGHKNVVLHHTTSGDSAFDPVKSAARLVHVIASTAPSTALGTFVDESGCTRQVLPSAIRAAVRVAAVGDQLEAAGYDLTRIGSYSLRSGGAMHLKLSGYDNDIIMKLGRWTSATYLRYIQCQIGQLTSGIATNMARVLRFHNVGA